MTSGETRLAAVIGWPVRHSLSPAIHNAAFAATRLDWIYLALPVAPGSVSDAITGMRALGIEGLSVTMPHKAPVAAALEHLTADATALGAVNCVFRDGVRLVGDNTDGVGFIDSLRRDEDIDPTGMRCVVFGAGGAARAVVRSLTASGAEQVTVVSRRRESAHAASLLAGERGAVGDAMAAASADLVVNATPVGMGDDAAMPFDPSLLRDGAIVADLVYHPETTPLLAAAMACDVRTMGGVGMLVHQAARSFERWTGTPAPVAVMSEAARSALS